MNYELFVVRVGQRANVGRDDAEEIAELFELDEFVRRVAARAGGDVETAAACSRAVMITLRETVPRSDFDDVTAQLPKNFIDLMGAVSER